MRSGSQESEVSSQELGVRDFHGRLLQKPTFSIQYFFSCVPQLPRSPACQEKRVLTGFSINFCPCLLPNLEQEIP
jgi:hypothetical protein